MVRGNFIVSFIKDNSESSSLKISLALYWAFLLSETITKCSLPLQVVGEHD